jgi:hypothetical protein
MCWRKDYGTCVHCCAEKFGTPELGEEAVAIPGKIGGVEGDKVVARRVATALATSKQEHRLATGLVPALHLEIVRRVELVQTRLVSCDCALDHFALRSRPEMSKKEVREDCSPLHKVLDIKLAPTHNHLQY